MTDKKKPNEGKRALQVWIDEETHTKFKSICSLRGLNMTEVTENMIEQWIADQSVSIPWLKEALKMRDKD
ncbi:hypothetical protein MXL54_08335 [Enterobacteriaceae bacterium G50]|nr:hypothetical protein [Enterobacteriaceae bacterium G50]